MDNLPDNLAEAPRAVKIAAALERLARQARTEGRGAAGIDALLSDIEALNAHHDRLAAREEQFRFTFEIATVGIAVVALDGRFVQVNRQLCDFLGYPPDALMGLTFQEITHPDDLQADLHHVERLTRGEIASFSMEKRYIRGDGRIAWAGLSATVRRDGEGRPLYFVSVVDDIGARKAAEERQSFLLGELAHRSKNLIMVLQSLVRHTASGETSVDAFARRLGDRLSALSASQDLLIGSEDEAVSMADLLARQMAAFLPPGDPRLAADGPLVRLGSRAAQSLGLAFHELATNACKYGALSTPGGRFRWTGVWAAARAMRECCSCSGANAAVRR